jgi:hypothetical protein
MIIYFLLFGFAILFFLILFLFKRDRNNPTKYISNSYIASNQNIEVNSNATELESPIDSVVHPNKKQNSFLNPNDDFGTLKKGVVIDNHTFEYEVGYNNDSNFTIMELGDESEVKSE